MGAILFTLVLATAPASPPPVAPKEVPKMQVQPCQAWGPKPPACIEPPLREMFKAYVGWRPEQANPPQRAEVVRRASQISDYDAPLPKDAFPAFLRQGDKRIDAWVEMDLVIGADGAVKSCVPGKIKANINTEDRKFVDFPADPGLGETTCAIVRATRTFRPAIDAMGSPVETTVPFDAHYSRERYEMLAPPAPPPPSRWIGREPWGGSKIWPPANFLSEGVSFQTPRFQDFLADKTSLPKRAVTGVTLDFSRDGRPGLCKVRLQSGDQRLDDAACAALMTVQTMPTRYATFGLPVEVTWKGAKASAAIAGAPLKPALIAPVSIPQADLPAANPPRWPVVVRIVLDPQGKPVACTVNRPSYVDKLDAASCRIARELAKYTPGKDGFGRPVVSGLDLRVDWTMGSLYWTGY